MTYIELFGVAMTPLMAALESGVMESIKLLLDHGADPKMVADQNINTAYFTVEGGNVDALDLMIEHGVAIDYEPMHMNFPLECAVRNDEMEMVKHLIALGVPSETSIWRSLIHTRRAYSSGRSIEQ